MNKFLIVLVVFTLLGSIASTTTKQTTTKEDKTTHTKTTTTTSTATPKITKTTKTPSNIGAEDGIVGELTQDQRKCIVAIVKDNKATLSALKNCHTTHGGIDCVKAIPELASCFA
jgi:uncharacterized surface protein with fasciclin (FAS1) repeats